MRTRARWFLACLAIGGAWAGRAEQAPAEPADWTVDNLRWQGKLAAATAIEISNPYGDVRLRASDADEVEASTMVQRRIADPVKPELEVELRGASLHIAVRYPSPPRGDLQRADLAVFVPARAAVTVSTRDGMIQARGLANDLALRSAGGDVFVSTSGTARVESDSGDITLTVPPDADAELRVRAPGEIAMKVTPRRERRQGRSTVLTFGNGTHALSVETRRGHVTLLDPGLS